MRRTVYISTAAALVLAVAVAWFTLVDSPPQTGAGLGDVNRASTDGAPPLASATPVERRPPPHEPLQLPEEAFEFEPVTGPSISGVVLDEQDRPVPGIRMYAYSPLDDEFGIPLRISSAEWTSFFQAKAEGRPHWLWKSIRQRQTRTDREGGYAFGGLPDAYIQLQAVSDDHELDAKDALRFAWRVAGLPGDVINWTATRLHHVRIELEYPDAITRPGTVVNVCPPGDRIGRSFDAGKLSEAKFLPGKQTFTAWNHDFELISEPVEFEVSPAGGTIRLRLKELPRLEVSVQFASASLCSAFELLARTPRVDGHDDNDGGKELLTGLKYCRGAGVWTKREIPIGAYEVVLVCLDREIASTVVSYSGGREKFILKVPEPAAVDCCVVTSNASAPASGEVLSIRYQYEYTIGAAIVWTKPGGPWLIQAPPTEKPESATGLLVTHSAWGTVHVQGDVGPGRTLDVQFLSPCTLHLSRGDLGYTLASSIRASLRNRSGQDVVLFFDHAIAVQPGQWQLYVESGQIFGGQSVVRVLELASGSTEELEIPELVPVRFVFPNYEGGGTLECTGRMAGTEGLSGATARVAYVIPGEYSVEFKPEFDATRTRTFTAAGATTVDFSR
jgi:hypothetical protein